MKNKSSLFTLVFVASLMFVGSCSANGDYYGGDYYGGDYSGGPCSGRFWSYDCQQSIHERDVYNNHRQKPRYYDYGYDSYDNGDQNGHNSHNSHNSNHH